MNNFKKNILGLSVLALLATAFATFVPQAVIASPGDQVKKGINAANSDTSGNCTRADGSARQCNIGDTINTVTNVLLFVIGTVSVIMIIVGGIRYTTSNGDSSQISAAKNTVLYAVVGLVVALLAYAIVNFVVTQFVK
jgi:multisubunit Na+/H+ antiporter MnhB subunit